MQQIETGESIGKGGYGDVYRCVDKATGRDYAMKTIPYGSVVAIEAAIIASFSHKHIINAEKIQIQDNKLCIIMPLAQCDLYQYLRNNKPLVDRNYPKLIRWMSQIARAVECLHIHNIIHGDIKPSNILVYDSSILKLADFTLSMQQPLPETTYSTTAYTITYRAPEVLMAAISRVDMSKIKVEWSMPADIWALGCTFFEMAYAYSAFKSQLNGSEENSDMYRKSLSFINHMIGPSEYIMKYGITRGYTFEPATPWPDNKTGDPLINHLLHSMICPNPIERISISDIFKDGVLKQTPAIAFQTHGIPEKDMIVDKNIYTVYPGLPAGVGDIVRQLQEKCRYMEVKNKIEAIHVIALHLSGYHKHVYIRKFCSKTTLLAERQLLKMLNFNILCYI